MYQPTLETERLMLRQFARTDAAVVQRLAGVFEVADMTLNIPHPYPDGAAEEWISKHPALQASGDAFTFAIVLRAERELCGAISLGVSRSNRHAELGYWLGVPYWNRGVTTEAARAVIHFGFEELDLHRIFARHFLRNPASGRVMQKIGMTFEGVQRDHLRKGESYESVANYGILRREWEDRLTDGGEQSGSRSGSSAMGDG